MLILRTEDLGSELELGANNQLPSSIMDGWFMVGPIIVESAYIKCLVSIIYLLRKVLGK